MASTPFDDNDPAIEERIRSRAYHLWEAEGKPHGRDEDYWERASELVHMEQAGNTGQIAPNDATEVVEDAAIEENLGEFPDRFADQGEKSASPRAKATSRLRRKPEHVAAAAPAEVEDKAPAASAKVAEPKKPAAKPAKVAAPAAAEKPAKGAKSAPPASSAPAPSAPAPSAKPAAAPVPKKAAAPKSRR